MATKSAPTPPSARQAKIHAAQKSQSGGANKIVIATVVVVVAIIAVVGGVVWSQSQKDAATGTSTATPAGTAMGEGYAAFASTATPAAGAPTVDLYEDFQCPICAQFEAALGSTLQGLAGEGKIVLKYHVLNFLDDKTGAANSTPAANGAFCAAADGKFPEFHNAVFAAQADEGTDVTQDQLGAWAATAGITGDALTTWQKCVADGTYTKYVTSVNTAAFEIPGFQGTPTLRINGETADLTKMGTPELLTQAIENATK